PLQGSAVALKNGTPPAIAEGVGLRVGLQGQLQQTSLFTLARGEASPFIQGSGQPLVNPPTANAFDDERGGILAHIDPRLAKGLLEGGNGQSHPEAAVAFLALLESALVEQ